MESELNIMHVIDDFYQELFKQLPIISEVLLEDKKIKVSGIDMINKSLFLSVNEDEFNGNIEVKFNINVIRKSHE